MELSVIIVNYNVKHFLEQCLHSVLKASQNITTEIFVVDNNSVDGSTQLIREKFPEVILIENKENVGFSKANNQAIKKARGKYVLLLNPDTVVEEDTFRKITDFMQQHPDAGGLGVKMIDGKGTFLPESKRGLPTPWVAFCKMFGLSRLFPKSKKFGRYHLSYLDNNEIHEVDVLAGAFMLVRKEALDKIGLLDETFFMYGEDIDLSYRLTEGGYKNYYYPETTIIHYKGESTKKGSLNYVRVFYKAMIIFAQKHYSGSKAGLLSLFIYLAIYFRAAISVFSRILDRLFIPLFDALLIFVGYLLITPIWEGFRFESGHYPPEFLKIVVPAYILIWLAAILFSGGYKKPVNLFKVARGILWGTISILLIYSLVAEEYRFSRALILIGSIWSLLVLFIYRILFHWMRIKAFGLDIKRAKKIAIVGHPEEATRVKKLLEETRLKSEFAGFIAIEKSDYGNNYIGSIKQLNEIIRINRINEIIFCAENISSGEIIQSMLELTQLNVDYKIAPPASMSIIGSNSIHTAGDLYVVNLNAISKSSNRRKKRFFDFSISLLILVLSPILVYAIKRKGNFIGNIFGVMSGKKSWVGFVPGNKTAGQLPMLKQGVLNPSDFFDGIQLDDEKIMRLNILYAKDYNWLTDVEILLKAWKKLGR